MEALFQDPSQNPYAGKKGDAFDIYVQDPVFNHLDNTFLKSLGYTVLSDPEAFDFITPSTFLFAPHLETWVFAQALDKAKPRLCVGTVMEECLNRYVDPFAGRPQESVRACFQGHLIRTSTYKKNI